MLRTYRRLNGISQERLAALLGYDKTYISMIETRRRVINDVGTLRQIAHTLGIPVHALGVTEADDATFAAMMQFAGSVLSLAEIARKSGHASDAVNELWPLVARLESRAAEGLIERESLAVLGRARLSLGVALGTLLPEEKLTSAAKWTGRALLIATHLDEPAFMTEALTMHGNELRKAGRIPAAIIRLRHAIARSADASTGAAACAMLARAAGEAGHAELFDDTMNNYRRQLDRAPDSGMLANEFTFREVHLRGLAGTRRAARAIEILRRPGTAVPAAPQWTAIERITAGAVLLAADEREEAEAALATGLRHAESARLPHQVQRAVRVATAGNLDAVADAGRTLLTRLADLVTGR
ncbi:hypothetical protein BJF78_01645 [Pseudonocardia sp. CNS-139]|nr:hypothetical protein BJF78_01645 [Pseudonocardia sp. CNS-139]